MPPAPPLREELRPELELARTLIAPLSAGQAIIIYGGGRGGETFIPVARAHHLHVLFVCDDDPARQTGDLLGIPRQAPESIRDHGHVPVIIALAQFQPVVARLAQWGIRRRIFSDDFALHVAGPHDDEYRCFFDPETIDAAWPQLEALDALLADDHSRQTLRNMLRYRLTRSREHSAPCPYGQYQHPLVGACAGDIVMDAGAWTGDTAIPFARAVGSTGHVYAFEPAAPAFASLQHNIRQAQLTARVTPINMGLGVREMDCSFTVANAKSGSSHLDAAGEMTVHLAALDTFCQSRRIRPTLIKMDIEGAERDAIEGAQGMIRDLAPKLQICLYHKPADLWEIPLRLQQIRPSYRFYLGHHELELAETVLYAIDSEV